MLPLSGQKVTATGELFQRRGSAAIISEKIIVDPK